MEFFLAYMLHGKILLRSTFLCLSGFKLGLLENIQSLIAGFEIVSTFSECEGINAPIDFNLLYLHID